MEGKSSPKAAISKELFPQPTGPTIANKEPLPACRLIFSKTLVSVHRAVTWLNVIKGVVVVLVQHSTSL